MAHSEEAIVEAARGDIPARFVRLLGISISPDENAAVVLLDTNVGGSSEPYPLQVLCFYDGTSWHGGGSSNGYGWSIIGGGVVTHWERAPADARAVIVRWREEEHEVPTRNGFFLFARWGVPASEAEDFFACPVRVVHGDGSTTESTSEEEFDRRRRRHQEMLDQLHALSAGRRQGIWIERREVKKD